MIIISTTVGKNPIEDMEQPSQSSDESEIYYLGAISRHNDLGSFQGKPFDLIVIQVYAPITDAKEADQFYEDLEDLLELTQNRMFYSSLETAMQKQEVKRYLQQQTSFALENKMKQGKG